MLVSNPIKVFNSSSPTTLGYIQGPETRGTLDILWSSLATLFLCLYATSHPEVIRIPIRRQGLSGGLLGAKALHGTFTILFPNYAIAEASYRYSRAKELTKRVKGKKGFENWTDTHSFFAVIGGFIMRARDIDDGNEEILEPETIAALSSEGSTITELTRGEILDRSKADTIVKLVTLLQVVWYTAQFVARLIQRLPFTTLEILTIFYIAASLPQFLYNWQCPQDVVYPVYVKDDVVDRCPWRMNCERSRHWRGFRNFEPVERGPPVIVDPMEIPSDDGALPRIPLLAPLSLTFTPRRFRASFAPNHGVNPEHFRAMTVVNLVSIIPISGLLIPAITHHISFPTQAEKYMWVAVLSAQIFLASYVILLRFESLVPDNEHAQNILGHCFVLLAVTFPYVLIEAIIGLRSLPEGAFINVKWENWIPFI